jgi:uncharacterized zinc-type alcohol dehydrogenase-like protein
MTTISPSTFSANAWGATSAASPVGPLKIQRREPRAADIQIDLAFCGICHSDLHQVRNEWKNTMAAVYPCVPGHEMVGHVAKVGSSVTKFKEGDLAAVGCLVDSCRTCGACRSGHEQFCEMGARFTYNSADPHLGGVTYGGYSTSIVVDEAFALKVSAKLDLAGAAPLLCAGITTYSPLRHWKIGAGHKVGVVGLGGLGHMGVKFAHAFGARVVVFTTSPRKAEAAVKLGASEAVVSTDPSEMQKHAWSFDFILDTVSSSHDLGPFFSLLKGDGTLAMVGASEEPFAVSMFGLLFGRKRLAGSLIGGIAETQEMLDFCAERGIVADVETIPASAINGAYERMLKGDVRYRFVIDIASMK